MGDASLAAGWLENPRERVTMRKEICTAEDELGNDVGGLAYFLINSSSLEGASREKNNLFDSVFIDPRTCLWVSTEVFFFFFESRKNVTNLKFIALEYFQVLYLIFLVTLYTRPFFFFYAARGYTVDVDSNIRRFLTLKF